MIKRKLYKCKAEGCTRELPILSKGLCPYHRHQQRKEEGSLSKKVIKPIKRYSKSKNSEKIKAKVDYYTHHLSILKQHPYSQASGTYIYDPSSWNIAHLIAKSSHPSIATDYDNVIYLTQEEHTILDSYLERSAFMDLSIRYPLLWDAYKKRVLRIIDRCEERTKFITKLRKYLKLN